MSEACKVLFLPDHITARVEKGASLLEAARACGLMLSGYCGGNGTCGKCAVEVIGGEPSGIQLACQIRIAGDMRVRIPEEGAHHILTDANHAATSFLPSLACRFVKAPQRAIGDCRSEWELLQDALGASVTATLPVLASLSDIGDAYALLYGDALLQLTQTQPLYHMAAFDIGTTSIVCYLLDGQSGRDLAVSSMLNPQAAFGADVISRARYALEHGGNDLQRTVVEAMNRLLLEACEQANVLPDAVCLIAAAGNTCMHHLLLGLSPASLVTAPYNALCRESLTLDAASIGLMAHPRAKLRMLPNIAGFVGADTVAGLIATGLAASGELTLLIDIGTNGELVLGDKRGRIACSTAAGPAFEGANIRCGMRGAEGAIDHVYLDGGSLRFSVIGGGKPRGICGSGLVDLVACLLDAGVIDESGRFTQAEGFKARMTLVDKQPAFVVDGEILLTQKDVRELQLAKAAMAAGIRLLCAELGHSIDDIRHIKIAGAFGNYLDPRSACRIGLLPLTLLARIEGIGNAAGEGVKRVLRDPDAWASADDLAFSTRFLELATRPDFQDCFVDELAFGGTEA